MYLFTWENVTMLLSSIVAAYPILYRAITKFKMRQQCDKILYEAQDIPAEIEGLVRYTLEQQDYDCAQTVPLKIRKKKYYDTATMCNMFDCGIGFSKRYIKKLTKILDKQKDEDLDLYHFTFSLDHHMFHMYNQHDQQLYWARLVIPCITELVTLPLLIQLASKHNGVFALGLLVSIVCKQNINNYLELLYTRLLNKKAWLWALDKNNDREELEGYIAWTHYWVYDNFMKLAFEQAYYGTSSSLIFPLLVRVFHGASFQLDIDDEQQYYRIQKEAGTLLKKLQQQPYQWPLRLLCFEHDSHHPFVVDLAQEAQERLKQLHN